VASILERSLTFPLEVSFSVVQWLVPASL